MACNCRVGYCPVCAAGTGYEHTPEATSCLYHELRCPERKKDTK